MDSTLQYMIGKMEHGRLIMGHKANVTAVGAHSHSQFSQGHKFKCPFCAGNHKAVDCNKYKSIQARKDRVIAQRLCFNCLTPGHSSKQCHGKKTCHICHLHHHTSLCNQSLNNRGDNAPSTKINQSSNANRGSQQQQSQQQHPHPRTQVQNQQPPVVAQHKSNTNKQHAPSSSSTPINTTSAHVSNINVSNFPHNVLPTATLTASYSNARTKTRAFFNTGSQRSFVSPELVCKLNLPVIKQIPFILVHSVRYSIAFLKHS